jgi:hypothetical protein
MPNDQKDRSEGTPGEAPQEASTEKDHSEAPNAGAGEDQEGLRGYWDAVLGPRPESVENRLIRELGAPHPGTLTFATQTGRVIVQIDPNGKVTLGEGVTADDAAEEFWTAMALKRKGMEERLMHFGVMEALLQRCGRADIAYEQAQERASREGATEEDKFREEIQRRNLEAVVHQMIEFSRGLLRRPDPPQEPG